MSALILFIYLVIKYLLGALVALIMINALVSWLILFDIINMRNRTAYGAVRMLDKATAPFLAPFRRFIRPIGGLDLSPLILVIIIIAAQRALLPPLFDWLLSLVGSTPPS